MFVGTDREARVYLRDAPDDARGAPYKLNDLFLSSDIIRHTVAGPHVAPVLAELVGGFPMVCNTLSLEFGSQQGMHVDTFFMPSPTLTR